ncbi:hypothetical protein NDU88_006487 [Pleurodeles waltl]|uniref:Uncharacterized protein n=1 Tax=Pleurodeles waltl TaxID=8319 RepID=A0AAV7LPS6_PLEWA|nr:hypothetical protein NDU88_006487 [Pleurodeles waltl]
MQPRTASNQSLSCPQHRLSDPIRSTISRRERLRLPQALCPGVPIMRRSAVLMVSAAKERCQTPSHQRRAILLPWSCLSTGPTPHTEAQLIPAHKDCQADAAVRAVTFHNVHGFGCSTTSFQLVTPYLTLQRIFFFKQGLL